MSLHEAVQRFRWQLIAGCVLLGLSALIYAIHYAIFRDAHHIFIFLVADIAFLPVEVLMVTLIIDQVLKTREKKVMLNKLNMVIGIFFSKTGVALLRDLSAFHRNIAANRSQLVFTNNWDQKAFAGAVAMIKTGHFDIDSKSGDLKDLKRFLNGEKEFLLTLLGNPNLLEHEAFTDLLWAVTHLSEELAVREDLEKLLPADQDHISVDIKRAYVLLLSEWFTYMGHLKSNYPHLFSLAVRTNPFDLNARVEFR